MEEAVEALIKKAGNAQASLEAQQFAQAAQNAANAMHALAAAKRLFKDQGAEEPGS